MSADTLAGWAVVSGVHPLRELTLYGIFDDADEASAWADENLAQVGDWWLAEVWKPT